MRRITLRILCEGATESNFVTQVLAPYLRPKLIFPKIVELCGGDYGRFHKGIKAELGRTGSHEFITTMIDLYKIGGIPEAEKRPKEGPLERVRRIEAGMLDRLSDPRFIPYVQLHEFETLVFVDLEQLERQFPDGEAAGKVQRLRSGIGNCAPEEIDDGEQTAPSKRLIREIPGYKSQKSIAGPQITSRIGLPKLRAACPHFDEWVTRLEQLAE